MVKLWLATVRTWVWLALIPNFLATLFADALVPLLHGDRDKIAVDPDAVPGSAMVMA